MNPFALHEALDGPRLSLTRATPLGDDVLTTIDAEHDRFLLYYPMIDPSLRGVPLCEGLSRELDQLWTKGEEFAYVLRDRASFAFVGHASVHALQWKHECAELAYWVTSASEGKGYVSEAVGVLESYLFDVGFHRVEIRCDVLNLASARVAERCGYTLDGTLRGHMKRRDGSYRDSRVFGKLVHERRRAET
jgi:RimJ/RimL family protein N-acetyltransferase